MILWFALFLIIVGISFILAFRSMKNYQESPQKIGDEYGLFLIRRVDNLNAGLLNSIRNQMVIRHATLSFERLFKGRRAALAVSGPKKILGDLTEQLGLLELEDYSAGLELNDVSAWEVGAKPGKPLGGESMGSIFQNLTELGEEDQFFWQIILGANNDNKNPAFKTQIRAAVYSQDPERRKKLTSMLQNLDDQTGLTKIPRPFSNDQLMGFFRARNLHPDTKGPLLNFQEAINLLRV